MKNFIITVFVTIVFLSQTGCFLYRLSPDYYTPQSAIGEYPAVMSMEEYETIAAGHRRPYIYEIQHSTGGSVVIVGVSHTRNPENPDLDTIRRVWNLFKPEVVFTEGKQGIIFPLFQDAVKKQGETGFVNALADKNGVPVFTWEPSKESEVSLLLKKFPAHQLAAFYSFRPYFSNFRFGKPGNPEQQLQDYIESRTKTAGLKGIFTRWQQLDSLWKTDYPKEKDWRDYSDEYGWPKGYFFQIFNASNLVRDEHLCNCISTEVNRGKRVFVTVGVSHAPRIENRLRAMLK